METVNNIVRKKGAIVIRSKISSPFKNIAIENTLFNCLEQGTCVFVYRNKDSVVIGRNQNPWLEKKEVSNVPVIRRSSGGGAVYHDLKNTNVSVITKNKEAPDATDFIQRTLSNLGIKTERNNKNDLLLNSKKISGSAQRRRQNTVLSHATLLRKTERKDIEQSLNKSNYKTVEINGEKHDLISFSGTKSRPSSVTSLKSEGFCVSHRNFYLELVKCLDIKDELIFNTLPEEMKHEEKRLKTWEWRYGKTPFFSFLFKDKIKIFPNRKLETKHKYALPNKD